MNEEVFDRQKKCLRDEFKNLLVFDSDFESGNLDKAILIKNSYKYQEYDLYTRSDSNSTGYNLWFYFSIQGNPNIAVGTQIKLNIMNLKKSRSLHS